MSGASEVPAIPEDVRLWWFLHILNACGKYGTYANDEPGEWVAAFCDDVEPKDTFNRACDLKLALCTHNSMDETSRVWITDAGKEWLARPVDTGREKALEGWQDISTAPRDGTIIDLWHEEFGRQTNCFWGKPQHECGEAGRYCDSDWHRDPEAWIDASFNEAMFEAAEFTHWRPQPEPPRALANPENGRG